MFITADFIRIVLTSTKAYHKNNFIFIESYKEDTVSIIQTVKSLTTNGIPNHANTAKHWIDTQDNSDLSDEKKMP